MKHLFKTLTITLCTVITYASALHAQTGDALYVTDNGWVGIGGTHFIYNSHDAVIEWGDGKKGALYFRYLSTKGSPDSYEDLMLISSDGVTIKRNTTIEKNATINGSLKADEVKDKTGYVTPKGGIIMWSGDAGNFDSSGKGMPGTPVEGWTICNGSNRTPNLIDRFIVGAGNEYRTGDVGGEKLHTLTIYEMPKHGHQFGVGGGRQGAPAGVDGHGARACEKCDTGVWTGSMGENQPHENRPPYYALLYIMKL